MVKFLLHAFKEHRSVGLLGFGCIIALSAALILNACSEAKTPVVEGPEPEPTASSQEQTTSEPANETTTTQYKEDKPFCAYLTEMLDTTNQLIATLGDEFTEDKANGLVAEWANGGGKTFLQEMVDVTPEEIQNEITVIVKNAQTGLYIEPDGPGEENVVIEDWARDNCNF